MATRTAKPKAPPRKAPIKPPEEKGGVANFRLTAEQVKEWDDWDQRAKIAGLSRRDWLFDQMRRQLGPKPKRSAHDVALYWQRGISMGLMCGRLDAAFMQEAEDALIDEGWARSWADKHPEIVQDVVQWLSGQPYGLRFAKWWERIMRDEDAHTAGGPS
ncbi:MAG: hypothetical protein M0Z85_00085 [Gammaproteobacteria bacterium]|nr:hypothetical protein [Gammaproteobacteria bacterium]